MNAEIDQINALRASIRDIFNNIDNEDDRILLAQQLREDLDDLNEYNDEYDDDYDPDEDGYSDGDGDSNESNDDESIISVNMNNEVGSLLLHEPIPHPLTIHVPPLDVLVVDGECNCNEFNDNMNNCLQNNRSNNYLHINFNEELQLATESVNVEREPQWQNSILYI
jgi:hypothetical protein